MSAEQETTMTLSPYEVTLVLSYRRQAEVIRAQAGLQRTCPHLQDMYIGHNHYYDAYECKTCGRIRYE